MWLLPISPNHSLISFRFQVILQLTENGCYGNLNMILDLSEQARKLFAGTCEFFFAAQTTQALPPLGALEIAFAGRSNVGKSSLLNKLTNRKALARTSHTPGRTQQLNFFAIGGMPPAEKLRIVDMPGYGYAAVHKQKIAAWTGLMQVYIRKRERLARIFVLIDSRHGLKPPDIEMLDMLDKDGVSYAIVGTKADELKAAERIARLENIREIIAHRPAAHPEIFLTSSRTGEGVEALRTHIMGLLIERGAV